MYQDISTYGKELGYDFNDNQYALLGKMASQISRSNSFEIKKVPHEIYTQVNAYDEKVLEHVFKTFNFSLLENIT